MAVSTLIKRIVDPNLLTLEERVSVATELGVDSADNLKIPVFLIRALTQEVKAGRLPPEVVGPLLTAEERVEAAYIMAQTAAEDTLIEDYGNMLILAEEGYYTVEQIVEFFDLENTPRPDPK